MKNIKKIILFFSLILYAILLLVYSNSQGVWHDEIYSKTFINGHSAYNFEGSELKEVNDVFTMDSIKEILIKDKFFENFNLQIQHEGHPPIYFISLKVWSLIFGQSEMALRSFSIFSGLLLLLVLYSLMKSNSKTNDASLLVILLLMFNPFLFYFFSEARMYSLALLFAGLTFSFWIKYNNADDKNNKSFIFYTISATALLYTHYYGLFFILTLIFFEIIKKGISKDFIKSGLPLLFFLPWIFMIKKQLSFHSNHWTDGSYTFVDSIKGFTNGLTELLFSPVSQASNLEYSVTAIAILAMIVFVFKSVNGKFWVLGMCVYFFLIYLFDLLLDHHTIIIPRYYIFILIFLSWGLFKVFEKVNVKLKIFTFLVLVSVGGFSIFQIYNLERAPKQMFREVASYIDNRYEPASTLIVIETRGPVVFGIANYIQGNFHVVFIEDYEPYENYNNVVFIEEVLGISYRNLEDRNLKEGLNIVPFVGLNLYE